MSPCTLADLWSSKHCCFVFDVRLRRLDSFSTHSPFNTIISYQTSVTGTGYSARWQNKESIILLLDRQLCLLVIGCAAEPSFMWPAWLVSDTIVEITLPSSQFDYLESLCNANTFSENFSFQLRKECVKMCLLELFELFLYIFCKSLT